MLFFCLIKDSMESKFPVINWQKSKDLCKYLPEKKVILVGEGNLSYAKAVAKHFAESRLKQRTSWQPHF